MRAISQMIAGVLLLVLRMLWNMEGSVPAGHWQVLGMQLRIFALKIILPKTAVFSRKWTIMRGQVIRLEFALRRVGAEAWANAPVGWAIGFVVLDHHSRRWARANVSGGSLGLLLREVHALETEGHLSEWVSLAYLEPLDFIAKAAVLLAQVGLAHSRCSS